MVNSLFVFRIRFRSQLRISVGFGDWLRIGDGNKLVDVMSMFDSGLIPGFGLTDRKLFPVSAPDWNWQTRQSDHAFGPIGQIRTMRLDQSDHSDHSNHTFGPFRLTTIIFPSFLGSSRNSRENSSRTFLAPYFRELEKVPSLVSNFGN